MRARSQQPIMVVVADQEGSSEADEKTREEFYTKLGLRHFGRMTVDATWSLWTAYALVLFAGLGGLLFLYAAYISKLMPDTGVWILDAMKKVVLGSHTQRRQRWAHIYEYLRIHDFFLMNTNLYKRRCEKIALEHIK